MTSDTRSEPEGITDLPRASWLAVLRRAVKQIKEDELLDRAAALTYYGVQSIFPGVLVLVSIIGLLGQSSTKSLVRNIDEIAPSNVRSFLHKVIDNAQQQQGGVGLLGVLGIILALWSASGYVSAFMRAANRIYGMPEGRPIWRTMSVRLAITVFTVVCLAAGLIIVVVTGKIADQIGDAIGIGSTAVLIWEIAKWPVLLLIFAIMLAVLYGAAPNVRQDRFRWLSPGAGLAVVVWLIASGLFAVYLANFSSYNKTYGSVAAVIVFLVWLWISNLAILLGAEFDAELDHERALRAGVPKQVEPFSVPKDARKFDDGQTRVTERVARERATDRDATS